MHRVSLLKSGKQRKNLKPTLLSIWTKFSLDVNRHRDMSRLHSSRSSYRLYVILYNVSRHEYITCHIAYHSKVNHTKKVAHFWWTDYLVASLTGWFSLHRYMLFESIINILTSIFITNILWKFHYAMDAILSPPLYLKW